MTVKNFKNPGDDTPPEEVLDLEPEVFDETVPGGGVRDDVGQEVGWSLKMYLNVYPKDC